MNLEDKIKEINNDEFLNKIGKIDKINSLRWKEFLRRFDNQEFKKLPKEQSMLSIYLKMLIVYYLSKEENNLFNVKDLNERLEKINAGSNQRPVNQQVRKIK